MILLAFIEFLKLLFIKVIAILMILPKLATPNLLKLNFIWNNCDDIIISVSVVTNKILSLVSNYMLDLVMWPKYGNSNISMEEVTMP